MAEDEKHSKLFETVRTSEAREHTAALEAFRRDFRASAPLWVSEKGVRAVATGLAASAVLPASASAAALAAVATENAAQLSVAPTVGAGSAAVAAPMGASGLKVVLGSGFAKVIVAAALAGGGVGLVAHTLSEDDSASSGDFPAGVHRADEANTPLRKLTSPAPASSSQGAGRPQPKGGTLEATPPPMSTGESAGSGQRVKPKLARSDRSSVEDESPATEALERNDTSQPQPGEASKASSAAAPMTELELLLAARAASRTSPTRALALAEEHAQLYPRSGHAQERDLIRISALVALGQQARAQAAADNFVNRYPKSPYLRRLSKIIGR